MGHNYSLARAFCNTGPTENTVFQKMSNVIPNFYGFIRTGKDACPATCAFARDNFN